MKIQLTDNLKAILIVVTACLLLYIIIFTAWNLSGGKDNPSPSSFFWDNRKDGYKANPLYDRKGNQNE